MQRVFADRGASGAQHHSMKAANSIRFPIRVSKEPAMRPIIPTVACGSILLTTCSSKCDMRINATPQKMVVQNRLFSFPSAVMALWSTLTVPPVPRCMEFCVGGVWWHS